MANKKLRLIKGTWFRNLDQGFIKDHFECQGVHGPYSDTTELKQPDVLHLRGEEIDVGCITLNEVVVDDVCCTRHHCHLRKDSERWYILDLGGLSGVYLGRGEPRIYKRVDEKTELKAGDEILIGTTRLLFE